MAKKNEYQIREVTETIDYSDWYEEVLELEPDLSGDDPILNLRLEGIHPAKIARILQVARLIGLAPEDIMKPTKTLIMTGGAANIQTHIQQMKRQFKIGDKEFEGREYVAPVSEKDEDEDSLSEDQKGFESSAHPYKSAEDGKLVQSNDPKAVEYAKRYLFNQVTGNIWHRLLIIAEQEPDELEKVASDLKAAIDDMVKRLS